VHVSRLVFAVLAWLFVGLVVLQVFYAGMGLLGGQGMRQHIEFGYLVAMFPLLVLIAAAVSRLGRLAWWTAGYWSWRRCRPSFRGSLRTRPSWRHCTR